MLGEENNQEAQKGRRFGPSLQACGQRGGSRAEITENDSKEKS